MNFKQFVTLVSLLTLTKGINGDFKNPEMDYNVPGGRFQFVVTNQQSFGWSTNNPYSLVEVWGDGFSGYDADTPTDFLELNVSDEENNIYQTIKLSKQTEYQISWKMKNRGTAAQYIELHLNDDLAATFNQVIDDAWHLATYQFNTGDERTWKIEFKAITEVGGLGNLFDTAHIVPIGEVTTENKHVHANNHHSAF